MAKQRILEDQTIQDFSRDSATDIYVGKYKRRLTKKRVITAFVSIISVLLISALVAAGVFYYQISSRLNEGGNVKKELSNVLESSAASTDPYYILLLGTDGRPGETAYRSDTLLLLRVDPGKKHATIVSIPRDTMVEIPGHGKQKINAAHAFGGKELAVKTISQFAGVPIAHYIEINFEGFSQLVDALGGVEVNVPERIDDKNAADFVIEPGTQVLNGEQALAFCRSRKFPDGDYSRMRHQRIFLSALGDKLLNKSDVTTMMASIDTMSQIIITDMSISELLDLMKTFRGFDMSTLQTYVVPSTPRTIDGVSYILTDVKAFKEMMACVNSDQPYKPEDEANLTDQQMKAKAEANNPDKTPAETKVDVLNGSSQAGVATSTANKLKQVGYDVTEIGNTNNHYKECTIYYIHEADKKAAEAIGARLNISNIQYGGKSLETQSHVVVVLGDDLPQQ